MFENYLKSLILCTLLENTFGEKITCPKLKKKFEMGSMKIRVTRNDTKNNNFAHCVEVGQINIVVT